MKRLFWFTAVVGTGILALLAWNTSSRIKQTPVTLEPLTIASTNQDLSLLTWIAEEKGFFKNNGLEVTIKYLPTGLDTWNALEKGEADVAETADLVFVDHALKGTTKRIFSVINQADVNEVISFKQKNITSTVGLRGKKVGVTTGSSAEFFLDRSLHLSGLSEKEVMTINLRPDEMLAALEQGTVDAVAVWRPHVEKIKGSHPAELQSFQIQDHQRFQWMLVADQSMMGTRPAALEKLLRAYIEAEAFVKNSPAETAQIADARTMASPGYFASIREHYRFGITLLQGLVFVLEDLTRWRRQGGVVSATPDYLDFIDARALKAVRPKSVTIIF
jgi:ABC-type nitrate/sulfonate/bicarbonate transport system substrate-binding protein